jgi:hypothetical protein
MISIAKLLLQQFDQLISLGACLLALSGLYTPSRILNPNLGFGNSQQSYVSVFECC